LKGTINKITATENEGAINNKHKTKSEKKDKQKNKNAIKHRKLIHE
jgi:hypothetical protein